MSNMSCAGWGPSPATAQKHDTGVDDDGEGDGTGMQSTSRPPKLAWLRERDCTQRLFFWYDSRIRAQLRQTNSRESRYLIIIIITFTIMMMMIIILIIRNYGLKTMIIMAFGTYILNNLVSGPSGNCTMVSQDYAATI